MNVMYDNNNDNDNDDALIIMLFTLPDGISVRVN